MVQLLPWHRKSKSPLHELHVPSVPHSGGDRLASGRDTERKRDVAKRRVRQVGDEVRAAGRGVRLKGRGVKQVHCASGLARVCGTDRQGWSRNHGITTQEAGCRLF